MICELYGQKWGFVAYLFAKAYPPQLIFSYGFSMVLTYFCPWILNLDIANVLLRALESTTLRGELILLGKLVDFVREFCKKSRKVGRQSVKWVTHQAVSDSSDQAKS